MAPRGHLRLAPSFTIEHDTITAIDVIADPDRLKTLDLWPSWTHDRPEAARYRPKRPVTALSTCVARAASVLALRMGSTRR